MGNPLALVRQTYWRGAAGNGVGVEGHASRLELDSEGSLFALRRLPSVAWILDKALGTPLVSDHT